MRETASRKKRVRPTEPSLPRWFKPRPVPTLPRSIPTTEGWEVLQEVLQTFSPVLYPIGRTRFHDLLETHLRPRFSMEAISEAHAIAGMVMAVIECGQDQELGRALVGILSGELTEWRRSEVVHLIRVCATRHRDGDADAVEILLAELPRYEPTFAQLRSRLPNLEEWIGRVYGNGGRRVQPEYCAAVFSTATGAFGDELDQDLTSAPQSHREKAKTYVKAVKKCAETKQRALQNERTSIPSPNVYDATDHKQMLIRAIGAGWISRGKALVDDVSEDGERLAVRVNPELAQLTLDELRAVLRRAQDRAEKLQPAALPLVGSREARKPKGARR